jgi:anti-sigma factor RsiW
MNCDLCKNELEDFLYGELNEARAAEVRAHLGNCAACAALRDELDRENEIFGRFYEQTSIEPSSEMWEVIRARISSRAEGAAQIDRHIEWRRRGWLEGLLARASSRASGKTTIGSLALARLRQAAFAALLVVLSVAATLVYVKIYLKPLENDADNNVAGRSEKTAPIPPPRQVATPAPSPSIDIAGAGLNNNITTPKSAQPQANRGGTPRQPINQQLADQELINRQIARAEREYQKAIRLLDRAIARQRDRLDPALIKQYESSLALIDDSINASRRALRERPDDPIAGQFLLAAYARKLGVMQDMAMK